jgi:hypothetical protein
MYDNSVKYFVTLIEQARLSQPSLSNLHATLQLSLFRLGSLCNLPLQQGCLCMRPLGVNSLVQVHQDSIVCFHGLVKDTLHVAMRSQALL